LSSLYIICINIFDLAEEPVCYGADKVFLVDDECLKIYAPNMYGEIVYLLAKKYKPEALLVDGALKGRESAPYIAYPLRRFPRRILILCSVIRHYI